MNLLLPWGYHYHHNQCILVVFDNIMSIMLLTVLLILKLAPRFIIPWELAKVCWRYHGSRKALNNVLDNFDCKKEFLKFSCIIKLFNRTFSSIFMSFVSKKLIIIHDRHPRWVTQKNRKLLKGKSRNFELQQELSW